MIKKETIIAMATALKLDLAAVTKAYDDAELKEVDFKPETLKIFTDAELTSREETLKTRHEKAGGEIAIKNIKEKAGLDFEGKTEDKLIEAFKGKVLKDANIEESTKIKELNTTIEVLRTNITTLSTEKEGILKQTKEAQDDTELLTWTIDKKPDNLTNKEWVALIKMNNEVFEENGQKFVKRDGKIVANPTDLKPIAAKDAVVAFIEERKLGKVAVEPPKPGGRGAGDSKTNLLGIANMKQFNEHLAAQNISPNGEVAQKLLAEVTTANANFDFSTKA